MKSILTLLTVLFAFTSLFVQAECKVTISYSINKTNPPSYTFRTDPKIEGATYYWYFGNDGKSDAPVPTYTFSSSGEFLIQVKVVKGNDVCYGELKTKFEGKSVTTNVVTLSGKGKVKKTGTDGCGLLITMDNGSILVPKEMAVPFEFKDGQYVELAAELYKEKASGCAAGIYSKITKISVIAVATPCTVKIISAKNSTNPVTYTFKTDPQTAGAKYYWKFGDNTVSDTPMPTHAFAKTGSYPVVVQVTGTNGKICTGELKGEFVGTTTTPAVVTLYAKGKVTKTSTDACGTKITLDDHKVLIPVEIASNVLLTNGQYIELAYQLLDRASNCGTGLSAKILKISVITSTTPSACTVKIVVTKNSTTPVTYTFKTDPQTAGSKYYWKFGDNTVSDTPMPTHAFASTGSYPVWVQVTGADGKTCTGELKTDFAGNTPTVVTQYAKGKVTKTGAGECGINITIEGGKILIPAAASVPFDYKIDQYYELAYQLPQVPSPCSSGLAVKIIKITPINTTVITPGNCTVKIISTKNTEPGSYTFRLDGTATYAKYYWKFSDNTVSDAVSPKHTFAKGGIYKVYIQATAADGKVCTGELSAQFDGLPVVELPNCKGAINMLLFDPTDNFCNGSATLKLMDEAGKEIPNAKYLWPDGRTGSSVKELCPGKMYTVKVTVENVCQKTTSFTLLAKPVWQASSVNGQNNFNVIAPVQGVLYEWDFGNGITKTGPEVNYNFQKDGVYDVSLKAISTAGTSASLKQIVVANNIANTAPVKQIDLGIYPNPAKEILRVDLKNPAEGAMTIEITDLSGHSVYMEKFNNDGSSHSDINIQNLKSGIYLLRIVGEKGIIGERKFIKSN